MIHSKLVCESFVCALGCVIQYAALPSRVSLVLIIIVSDYNVQ